MKHFLGFLWDLWGAGGEGDASPKAFGACVKKLDQEGMWAQSCHRTSQTLMPSPRPLGMQNPEIPWIMMWFIWD